MQTLRNHTLADIAVAHGVNKRAAQNWLSKAKSEHGDIGEIFGGTRMFSDDEKAILLSYAAPRKAKPQVQGPVAEPTSELTAQTAKIEIYDSASDRTTLAAPELPNNVDLSHLRSGTVESFDNPLELIQGARHLIHARRQAMNLDLQKQIARYHQTEAAAVALDDEVRALELEQNRYQIESNLLGILQNQRTAELSKSMGKLNGNGSQSEAS